MTTESPDELRARVAALEAENAALKSAGGDTGRPVRRSRTVLAAVLILLGVLLAPVAVISGWASWTLTDTERFVATYAPLADSPEVQAYVVDQAMVAVEERVDFDQLTQQVVDGLVSLGTGPRATAALRTLQGSIAEGLRNQVRDGLITFVESDRFSAAWAESLRIGHEQLIGTLGNDPDALATISADGSVGIPLGPIVEQVKVRLVERGITVADRMPTVDRTLVLVQSDLLPTVQLAYGITVALGTWLPWVVIALLVGGVVAANRRHRALLWAAGAFAFTMAVLAIAIAVGRIALIAAVPASVLPGTVSTLFYDAATGAIASTAVSAAVLGVAVGIVGWLAGPFRTPVRLRGFYRGGADQLRTVAEGRGLSTGRVGDWVYRRRTLLFGLIALVAGVVIVLNRPVDAGLIGWTAFWSALAVVVVTLVERPGPVESAPAVEEQPIQASL
jgi:hypothetical protein